MKKENSQVIKNDVQATIYATEAGVTIYANRAMLVALVKKLKILITATEDEFREIHIPEEFYADVSMFEDDLGRNIKIVMSPAIANVFKSVPNFIDVDGSILFPRYGLTIMHHKNPLAVTGD